MILKTIKYCKNKGEKNEWSIRGNPVDDKYLDLEQINLIVGRNASGKTNTIQIIREIADLLAGDAKLSELIYDTSTYELGFEDGNDKVEYFLDFKNGRVIQETLKINEDKKLDRAEGKLFYAELGKNLAFETDKDSLALARRDSKQQPFFESLYRWGKNLSHYKFGGKLGKNFAVKDANGVSSEKVDLKDGNDVTKIFIKGEKLLHKKFVDSVIEDMKNIDYLVDEIDVMPLVLKSVPYGFVLKVQETELNSVTNQLDMSQGMFRALSLLIQLNYSLLAKIPSCILIDDIGEGLDYERSKALIDLIIEKVKDSSVQIIMTTNDRFVMNKIPLEYWSVIKRERNMAVFYNYKNSQKIFDDFEFTGLDNFSFFSSNYYQEL
ncbi:AAA family ATPase [Candidatus Parabeggiatoa sp. HSG14]|uniref:AAA family ATPase n=1 Tax=Candidatus Parabeggiatoa sp. HSG14 TaxID=3055593 RepID=UPI0025A92334|nr:AAA family ATPase [Thiotrichales bacterium HSG14]